MEDVESGAQIPPWRGPETCPKGLFTHREVGGDSGRPYTDHVGSEGVGPPMRVFQRQTVRWLARSGPDLFRTNRQCVEPIRVWLHLKSGSTGGGFFSELS